MMMIANGLIRKSSISSSSNLSSSILLSSSSFSFFSFLPLRVLLTTTATTKSSESFCLSSRTLPSPSSLQSPYLSRKKFYTKEYSSSSLLSSPSSETTNTTTTTVPMSEYWNREESSTFLSSASSAVKKEARIVSLSPLNGNDPNNIPLEHPTGELLPEGATVVGVFGNNLDESDIEYLKKEKCNVIFVSPGITKTTLATLIRELNDSLEWIHSRSAGIDVLLSDTLTNSSSSGSSSGSSNLKSKSNTEDSKDGNSNGGFIMTNSKGIFSSTLAEYTMMACSYFAKDLPQLLKNKSNSKWKKYNVLELRGSTIGIVGYGDIGRATAKLAKAYGMKVIALRRRRIQNNNDSESDPYCDILYDRSSLNKLFSESDYVLCSTPLTDSTYQMIGKEQFDCAKKDLVFINVGRGPVVDECALIDALTVQDNAGTSRLKGAGLDVFCKEPIGDDSELWKLDNLLLSPHNMDQTDTFMLESTQFFVDENLPRFIRGHPLLNHIDKKAGY